MQPHRRRRYYNRPGVCPHCRGPVHSPNRNNRNQCSVDRYWCTACARECSGPESREAARRMPVQERIVRNATRPAPVAGAARMVR